MRLRAARAEVRGGARLAVRGAARGAARLGIALAAGFLTAAIPAGAQELTLKISHPLPPPSTAHVKFLVPWTQKVEAECPGRVRFQILPAMQLGGTPAQLYDQARDGLADMIWTVLG